MSSVFAIKAEMGVKKGVDFSSEINAYTRVSVDVPFDQEVYNISMHHVSRDVNEVDYKILMAVIDFVKNSTKEASLRDISNWVGVSMYAMLSCVNRLDTAGYVRKRHMGKEFIGGKDVDVYHYRFSTLKRYSVFCLSETDGIVTFGYKKPRRIDRDYEEAALERCLSSGGNRYGQLVFA